MELSGPGVQYIADNQLYNSIITAHALLMIFFMVKKYYILNSHFTFFNPLTLACAVQDDDGSGPKGEVNSDNNNSPLLSECNNNDDSYKSNNENKNSPNTHNYVKILVDDPYNNRDIILKVTKRQSRWRRRRLRYASLRYLYMRNFGWKKFICRTFH
jgi:hypothetical protein